MQFNRECGFQSKCDIIAVDSLAALDHLIPSIDVSELNEGV